MQVNGTGDILALSCVKEVQSSENPVCCKRAFVLRINAEFECGNLQLEPVNVPFGVIKASSLQVN